MGAHDAQGDGFGGIQCGTMVIIVLATTVPVTAYRDFVDPVIICWLLFYEHANPSTHL